MSLTHIESIADLDNALEQSAEKPVFLFKHSTRCPISTFADNNYQKFADNSDADVVFTHLDLIAHRDVSDAIAEKTGIAHQSPQAILVVGGQAVWNASHTQITEESLSEAAEAHSK